MQLTRFVDRLDERLRTDAYAPIDASANGLQVGPENTELDHVAFAVDAAVETIEAAVGAGAGAMVVHHGLSWGGFERVTDTHYRRLKPLFEHDIALYVSHLPLDGHPDLGNAAGVGDVIGLTDRSPFGDVDGEYIGQRGRLDPATPVEDVASQLEAELDTGGRSPQVFPFGPDQLEEVAIVTGSGADFLDQATTEGADALLTGEGKQQLYHEAKEANVSVILAGHYATETFGVRSLQGLADEWGLETTFIDRPTRL
ncbi:MAG: Nif3-like dinuclear metal center hexameric protein [Halobacteriales archaeon]